MYRLLVIPISNGGDSETMSSEEPITNRAEPLLAFWEKRLAAGEIDEAKWYRGIAAEITPSRSLILREVSEARGRGPDPRWASATCLEKVKLPAERVLYIDHLFARMQRLNTYEAKTNAMTRIGSNLSQVLPPPFSCE